MKVKFLIFFLLLTSSFINAQVASIDKLIHSSKHDTVKIHRLIDACDTLEDDFLEKYNSILLRISSLNMADKDAKTKTSAIKGYSTALVNNAWLIEDEGDIITALDYYTKAYKLSKSINYTKIMASAINSLAMIHNDQGEKDVALKYYFENLKIILSVKDDSNGLRFTYNNIAGIYRDYNKLDSATYFYRKSMQYTPVNLINYGYGIAYNNLASISINQKNYKEALTLLDSSIKYKRKEGKRLQIGRAYVSYANTYYFLEDYKYSKIYVDSALIVAETNPLPEFLQAVYNAAHKIYSATKQYDKAYYYFKQYHIITDSLLNEKTKAAAIEKRLQRNFDVKEQHILIDKEKARANAKLEKERRVYIVISSIIIICIILVFSILLYRRFKITKYQNQEIKKQKTEVENKNRLITDSINYASTIQQSILPSLEEFNKLGENVLFYKPKDIVSGDFYWTHQSNHLKFFAIADCTGHGVPGAFMSVLGINLLDRIIKEENITQPDLVLNRLSNLLAQSFGNKKDNPDSMEMAFVCFNTVSKQLTFSSSGLSLYCCINGQLSEIKGDSKPLGSSNLLGETNYKTSSITLEPNTWIYFSTDGFPDQKGINGKKFFYKPLRDLFLKASELNSIQQLELFNSTFTNWKGALEQIDDVCVVGLKFI